jgi:TolB-like protein/DNA-binding winged helix-turn-helix (wHTH) protein
MPISEERSFSIADWRVFLDEDSITRGEQRVRLESMAMNLLVYLASRSGEVVSRADIEKEVWRGGIVGYDAVTSTVIKLRKALGDNAKQPSYIATVPKRGYQLIAPVTRHDSEGFASNATPADPRSKSGIASVNSRILTSLGILLVLASLVYWLLQQYPDFISDHRNETASVSAEKPSIAVLPFTNLSGGLEQEYFSDGITEDIITELSRLSNLIAIARNSSFRYKNQTPKAQEVGVDLGVAYILEGSVRRAGERIRITAQLVDTNNGHQVWANRYDQNLGDIFSLQDAITEKVVSSLSVQLGDRERILMSRRATSWDYPHNLGRAQYTMGNYKAAIEYLESALSRNESALIPRVFLAASYAGQGQLEDAEWQILQIETNHPNMTLTHLENTLPLTEGSHKSRLFADLKTAGMSQ